MKMQKIIRSAVLIVVIACIALYFRGYSGRDKFSEEAIIQDSLFGFTVGDTFDKEKALKVLQLESGETLYRVTPITSYKGIEDYNVTIDENSKINTIRGRGFFNSLQEAEKAMDTLANILEIKYKQVLAQGDLKYYKSDRGLILIMFLRKVNGKYEVHLHSLSVEKL